MIKKKVIIVGAGPAGLAAALALLDKGLDVMVLEEDSRYVGGLSRTIEWQGFRFDIGGHRFFSKNLEIVSWWKERLGKDFIRVRRLSRIIYNGHFFDYPLRIGNALKGLGLKSSIVCAMSFLKRQMLPFQPETSFEDYVRNRFGDRLYEIFFKTYTEKVWGIPCNRISADWASQRIQGMSLGKVFWKAMGFGTSAKTLINEFDYPRLGAGMMWERARDEILARRGLICMGRSVCRFEQSRNRVAAAWSVSPTGDLERHPADAFIVSMPLRDCIEAFDDPIAGPARLAAKTLRYRALIIVCLLVRGSQLFPDNWIYVHTPHLKVGRIQNFNNWSIGMVGKAGITALELEYFCNETDSLWQMDSIQLVELAKREINELGLARSCDILEGQAHKVEKAYPVYDTDYRRNIELIRSELVQFANFQVVGRNGMHKYNNQDHSMLTGILAAENAAGVTQTFYDVWKVNTDAEYLESGSTPGERAAEP